MGILCPLFRCFPWREDLLQEWRRHQNYACKCQGKVGLSRVWEERKCGTGAQRLGYPASPRDAPMKLEPYEKLGPQQMARAGWMGNLSHDLHCHGVGDLRLPLRASVCPSGGL